MNCTLVGSTHMYHLELKLQGIICSKVMEICRYLPITKSAAPNDSSKRSTPNLLEYCALQGVGMVCKRFHHGCYWRFNWHPPVWFCQGQLNSAGTCIACTLLQNQMEKSLEFSCWISEKLLIGLTTTSSYLSCKCRTTWLAD